MILADIEVIMNQISKQLTWWEIKPTFSAHKIQTFALIKVNGVHQMDAWQLKEEPNATVTVKRIHNILSNALKMSVEWWHHKKTHYNVPTM